MSALLDRIKGLKIPHDSCEDGYYACPKSEDGCANDQWEKDECNCGADEHNAEVDAVFIEVNKEIERLRVGLTRLALCEAFHLSGCTNEEERMRMRFAEKILDGAEPSRSLEKSCGDYETEQIAQSIPNTKKG
jgi:hypothetical protein